MERIDDGDGEYGYLACPPGHFLSGPAMAVCGNGQDWTIPAADILTAALQGEHDRL